MSMILAVLVLAVLAVVFYAAMQPPQFRIERSAHIAAPPQAVFAQVNDFRNWQHWSPWARLDPAARGTFAGPEQGKGAAFSWAGNRSVGEGSMTILDSELNDHIRMQLDFRKPMQATNIADFSFAPEGRGTRMTWAMSGTNSLAGRVMCLAFNPDKMVGGMFETGMRNIDDLLRAKG